MALRATMNRPLCANWKMGGRQPPGGKVTAFRRYDRALVKTPSNRLKRNSGSRQAVRIQNPKASLSRFIRIRRKQQRTDGIPHADDFTHSKVGDSFVIGFLGSLETRFNSEEMRGVVQGFPKLDLERRPNFCSPSACFVLIPAWCLLPRAVRLRDC